MTKFRAGVEHHQTKEAGTFATYSSRINERLDHMQEALQVIHAKDEMSSEAIESVRVAVKEAHDGIRAGLATWSERFKLTSASLYTEIEKASLTGYQTVRV